MNILIHTCTHPSELTQSLQLFLKTWGYWSLEDLSNALKTGNYTLYYAQAEEEIVGALLVLVSDDFVDVIYLYTASHYRRRNIGLNLLTECESVLKKGGLVKKFLLEVRKDNIPAQKLYDAFGMKLISERKKYYKDGCDALIYCKDLK